MALPFFVKIKAMYRPAEIKQGSHIFGDGDSTMM